MDVQELTTTFQAALEAGDFETAASYMADDFVFSGATRDPIGGQEWLGMSMALKAGFPDLSYNFVIESIDGNVVTSSAQLTGTHNGDLDLSAMGMGVIPATGIAVSNPRESNEAIVEDGKVKSLHVHSSPESGLMGLLSQLGVEPPQG